MLMRKRLFLLLLSLLPLSVLADEGMWMVNAISRALEQNMTGAGCGLAANEIYNEDAVSLSDAIVSLDFGCTGSMISQDGLLITNHHCAYADVHALSTPEHNYLEDGFWALGRSEEIPIKGKKAYFLRRVLDVTGEVAALSDSLQIKGKPFGMRKLSYMIETKYNKATGLEASLSSMWSGSKYYMALYEVYSDLRLVAAPPVSIAAFGGDEDNWEWPQHKCDFAMYRIYAGPDGKPAEYSEDNVPMHPRRYLDISVHGYQEGDFAMVMGYPGRTERYSSSPKVRYATEVVLPITNEIRAAQMEIIRRHMDADPAVRLKYADYFFSLSNVQELQEGEVQCCRRFEVVDAIRQMEDGVPALKEMLPTLDRQYAAVKDADCNRNWYRETLIRGTRISRIATRIHSLRHKHEPEREKQVEETNIQDFEQIDLRVEKDLFRYSVDQFYEHVDSTFWGPFQKELKEKYGSDYDALCNALWIDRMMTQEDDIFRFFTDISIVEFNRAADNAQKENPISDLSREYTRALYQYRLSNGIPQYPDANSTMRLTYGNVLSYSPRDGVTGLWQSTHSGLLAKVNPDNYDFNLKPDWEKILRREQYPLPVNFITNNDITGGNSGSPVLNAQGELIGLAFDGNKESLASNYYFTPDYNRCVCVDIRFVLFTLRNYAGMGYIFDEITTR